MKITSTIKTTGTTAPSLWIVLAKAYGSLATYAEQRVSAAGLCLSDFMALEALLHKGPLTMSAIGEKILLANASMTSAVDRLEKHGFVTRNGSTEDRRIRVVELTSEGRKFISEMYKRHERDLESVMTEISATERAQLRRTLKKIGLAAKAAISEQQHLTVQRSNR
jgi:MarR family 2-MHQ and catechol resistance regulon transcriptional repressor